MNSIQAFYDRLQLGAADSDHTVTSRAQAQAPATLSPDHRRKLIAAMLQLHHRRQADSPATVNKQHQYYQAHSKSVGLAFTLSLILGPVGVLYASPLAGVILILTALGTAWTLGPIALILWPIAIITAIMAADSHNLRVKQLAAIQYD